MVSTAAFSHLVSLVYDAALTPARWGAAMSAIHRNLAEPNVGVGAVRSTALAFADGSDRWVVGELLPEAEQPYGSYYGRIDHVLEAVESGPVGAVRTGDELIATRTATEFHADWIRPNDIEDGLFVRLTGGPKPTSFIVAGSRRSRPFVTSERLALVHALVPHLQQALSVQRHVTVLAERADTLSHAVNRLSQGVIVVSSDMQVVESNLAAQEALSDRDGLEIHKGALQVSRYADQQHLKALVGQASSLNAGIRRGGSMHCARISRRRGYVLHVLPIGATDFSSHSRPLAMILVVDPARDPLPANELLRQVYGLTSAEASVAHLVLYGDGVQAISDRLSLSSATVRTHLRAIFRKTGTHRQAELVRLLSAVMP